MAAIIARSLTFAAAKQEGARLSRNIGRRVARLEERGINTKAIRDYRALEAAGAPQTRNEAVSRVSTLQRLDKAAGARSATAETVHRKEAHRAENRAKMDRSRDFGTLNQMGTDEIAEAYKLRRRKIMGDKRRVERSLGENPDGTQRSNHALQKLDEVLASIPEDPSRRQMLSILTKFNTIENYEGMTVTGARRQETRGQEMFGDAYKGWSDKERGAVWDEVHRMVSENHVTSSGAALDIIAGYTNSDHVHVHFLTEGKDDDGNVYKLRRPVVGFGFDGGAATKNALTKQAMGRTLERERIRARELRARTPNPLGPMRYPR